MTHAVTGPVKRLLTSIKDGTHGTFARIDGGRPLLSAKNVLNGKLVVSESESEISEADYKAIVGNGFPRRNDVLLTIVGTIGRTCVFAESEPLAFQRSVAFLRPRTETNPRYLSYLLQSHEFQEQLALATKVAAQGGVYMGDVWEARCTHLPVCSDQERIANFLDEQTARIDALIDEKTTLIARISELEEATIAAHILGKDVGGERYPTNIAEVGDLPKDWQLTPMMRLTDSKRPIMYGIVLPGPNVDEGPSVPIVKGGDVRPHRLKLELLNRTTPEIEAPYARARLAEGDIVYSIRGTIGDAELVPAELAGANITQDVARIAPKKGVERRWLLYAAKAKPVFAQLESRSLGAAVRGINIRDLKRARVPTPPLPIQKVIANALDASVAHAIKLREHCEKHILILREYRSSLISAAVTGQLNITAIKGRSVEAA